MSERIAKGQSIWFAGDVGTGKTTLAMLISKMALESDHSVAIYSLPRLLLLLRTTYDESSRFSLLDLTDRLCAVDLLHIDDIGTEQSTPWVLEQLYNIVNTRYEDGRPLLLTTNLIASADIPVIDSETGKQREDPLTGVPATIPRDAPLREQIGDRTVSRIYEICGMPKFLYGTDKRPRPDEVLPPPATDAPSRDLGASRLAAPDEDAMWEDAAPSRYGRRALD
jgi:DNA replication protein DnaC